MSASMRSSATLWSASVRIAFMRISDLPDVDLIVFLVRPDEAHEDHLKLVVDPDHEPVVVALDVENHAVADNAGAAAPVHTAPEVEVPVRHETTPHEKQYTIIVNAEEKQVTPKELTFDQVVSLTFPNASKDDNRLYTSAP